MELEGSHVVTHLGRSLADPNVLPLEPPLLDQSEAQVSFKVARSNPSWPVGMESRGVNPSTPPPPRGLSLRQGTPPVPSHTRSCVDPILVVDASTAPEYDRRHSHCDESALGLFTSTAHSRFQALSARPLASTS